MLFINSNDTHVIFMKHYSIADIELTTFNKLQNLLIVWGLSSLIDSFKFFHTKNVKKVTSFTYILHS